MVHYSLIWQLENCMRWNDPMGEEQVHSHGTSLCSLDAKCSKDKPRRGLCSERGLKAPHQDIRARALVPAWHVCYLRKASVTRNSWDTAVGLSHCKRQAVFVGGHGKSCGGSHARGRMLHGSEQALSHGSSINQCSWGSDVGTELCRIFFYFYIPKLKDNWKIAEKNETRRKFVMAFYYS